MPRQPVMRTIHCKPDANYYKPKGIPLRELEEVVLGLDESEAIRLADLEGMTQEEVSEWMHISRATVGRILETGRRKLADAITNGKALKIEGGPVQHHTIDNSDTGEMSNCKGCQKNKQKG
ncbi:MAG: hypothetical protein CR997_01355 [Acidobacteria bacterium]|nr:MAG: hypothetical protein CR997_01355 [Acidobacteriota bacterium]